MSRIERLKMKAQDCNSYVKCNASICPLDKDSLENCLWYPNEEICKTMHSPLWIKQQKKIKKKCRNTDTYFTYEMLNRNFVVGKAIKGLDPDKERSPQLKKWLKNHKELRELTDEEKENKRRLFVINVLEKNKKKEKIKIGV